MTFSLFIWWTNRGRGGGGGGGGGGGCKEKYTNLRQVTHPQTLSHQFVETD